MKVYSKPKHILEYDAIVQSFGKTFRYASKVVEDEQGNAFYKVIRKASLYHANSHEAYVRVDTNFHVHIIKELYTGETQCIVTPTWTLNVNKRLNDVYALVTEGMSKWEFDQMLVQMNYKL